MDSVLAECSEQVIFAFQNELNIASEKVEEVL